jgi:hypothetical protein
MICLGQQLVEGAVILTARAALGDGRARELGEENLSPKAKIELFQRHPNQVRGMLDDEEIERIEDLLNN